MTTVPFDTLKYARALRDAGVTADQSEAFADARAVSMSNSERATKADLRELELRMTICFGVLLAATVGILTALERFFLVPS